MEDLSGRIYNSWEVNSFSHKNEHGCYYWNCTCLLCNRDYKVGAYSLKSGKSKRCMSCAGKLHPERLVKATQAFMKSGLSQTKIYQMLANMHHRCEEPKAKHYENYGARGIKVCSEWSMENVQSFYDWAIQNGYQEGLEIDRIDVNGDYCPSNCRFVTKKQNERNRTNNHMVEVYGERMCLAEAVDRYSEHPYMLVLCRVHRGMPIMEALTRPKRVINAKRA